MREGSQTMYGKILKVNNRGTDIKIENKEVILFCCFKDLKYGNSYAIFCDKENPNNTLLYGTIHFKEDSIVIIDTKKDIKNLILDLIDILSNNKKIYDYQILDITKFHKIDLISNNTMELTNDKLKKLETNCVKQEESQKKKKRNEDGTRTLKIILILLFIILALYTYLYIDNKDNYELNCTRSSEIKELSKVKNEVTVYFSGKNKIIYIDSTTKYIFDTKIEYQTFKTDTTLQSKYLKKKDEIKYQDSDNTVIVINRDNNVNNSYKEIKELYTSSGYKCEKRKNSEK